MEILMYIQKIYFILYLIDQFTPQFPVQKVDLSGCQSQNASELILDCAGLTCVFLQVITFWITLAVKQLGSALGMSLRKVSYETFVFSVFTGRNNAQRLYNRYNLWPCSKPAHVGECWSSSPKHQKLDGCVKIYNSVSVRSPLTKSKKENFIDSAAI